MDNDKLITTASNRLLDGISDLISVSKQKVAVSLNVLYWSNGDFINKELKSKDVSTYGKQILATLLQECSRLISSTYSGI